jgi:type IV pilus assembly protein PilA
MRPGASFPWLSSGVRFEQIVCHGLDLRKTGTHGAPPRSGGTLATRGAGCLPGLCQAKIVRISEEPGEVVRRKVTLTMRRARGGTANGFTLVELMIIVVIVGVLAVLAIYGVRKYAASSKTAEARNSAVQIGRNAATAFERESMQNIVLTKSTHATATRALCASASVTVPSTIAAVQGKKYQSSQASGADWKIDESTNKGFSCLKFLMTNAQYYMYGYTSDGNLNVPTVGTQFTAVANGDLNANGTLSTFELFGAVSGNNLYMAPNLAQILPEE